MKPLRTLSNKTCLMQQKAFENWYQTPLGRSLLADQRKVIRYQLDGLYGVHQLEMMVSHRLPVANTSAINHRICCVPNWEQDLPENTLVSLSEELSLASDTIDLVVLHHTLDFAAAPHQTLREAARVLRSGGYMLIVGLNPAGLWGLMRLFRNKQEPPWSGRFISSRRIEDWLELLDFRIENVKYRFSRPPWQRNVSGTIDEVDVIRPMPSFLGAYYSLLTRKQKGAMTLVQPKWRTAEVIGMPVASGINKTAVIKETD
ncbi:MAG: SAM-dependent methyltransferase [Gammaproteobacteria bacterium]|nr:MAG: SAM-dependent methyltransferase [Gammaproteobacteria bacterium]